MATGGYGVGGSSTAGPSAMFGWLPWKGYREISTWFEEFVDAIGSQFSILENRFVSSTARSHLLDPTYTPIEVASSNLATSTAPPTGSVVTDTMLDVLLYIARGQYPVNPRLTTAQKQGLVTLGWDILRRKGTRQRLLNLVSQVTNGPINGWTTPPFLFGMILPDGAPSPGYGDWTPVPVVQVGTVSTSVGSPTVTGTGTSFLTGWAGYKIIVGSPVVADLYTIASVTNGTSLTLSSNAAQNTAGLPYYIIPGASVRPWAFDAARSLLSNVTPAWSSVGIGYSQFRAGYSAAGEIVLASGARIGSMINSSFSSWSGGLPTTWAATGSATVVQAVGVAGTSYEFSDYACRIDLTGAAAASTRRFAQAAFINDQRSYRVEVDYAYTNAQNSSTLTLSISDDKNYYYNIAAGTWSTTATLNPMPPSSTRTTYAVNVTPQPVSSTVVSLYGVSYLNIAIAATSDGTATTQTTYDLFRCDLLEPYNQAIEASFEGEPIGWWPLVNCFGLETGSRAGTSSVVQFENFDRSLVRTLAGTVSDFSYHPAVSAKGFRSNSTWTNLAKGSNVFTAPDWTAASSTYAASQTASPVVANTSSAPMLTANVAASYGSIDQDTGVNPASKSYIAGVWAKNINGWTAGDVVLSLISGGTTKRQAFTVTGTGWKFLAMPAKTFGGGDTSNLHMKVQWDATGTGGQLSLFCAYLYDVTGKTDVLYPPVSISASTVTSASAPSIVKATTATTDTNVLHPLTLRSMMSVASGALSFTVVPTFGAGSQPNAFIFECSQNSTTNGVYIDISSGSIRLRRRDSSSTSATVSLAMTTSASPSSSQVTWLRDQALTVRARWSADGSMSLAVGSANVSGAAIGGWSALDTSVSKIRIGCDNAGANQFDGMIRDVRSVVLGNPAS
jgi:hypothetical protein